MSTDGVGTKVMVAREAGRFDTVGEDLVNHSVNDILVHGARPLAFLDYVAGSGLTVEQVAGIVEGVARGCRAHEMALAGGETAQMPGLYQHGDFDAKVYSVPFPLHSRHSMSHEKQRGQNRRG